MAFKLFFFFHSTLKSQRVFRSEILVFCKYVIMK